MKDTNINFFISINSNFCSVKKIIIICCLLIFSVFQSIAQTTVFASGFETGDPAFTYDGVQIPTNSTSSPNEGTNHGNITGACSGPTSGCYDGSIITSLLSFNPGCTYTITLYGDGILLNPANNVRIRKSVTATNAAMTAAAGADIIADLTTAAGGYSQLTASFTVSAAESKYVGIWFKFAGQGGGGGAGVNVDKIVITKSCSSCEDATLNGDETSTDCGGTSCASVAPAGGTVTISPATTSYACGTAGTITFTVAGYTGYIQWQSSDDNSTWYDISGQNFIRYIATIPTNTTYYRVKTVNDGCTPRPAYSNTITITITGTSANTWLTTGTSAWGTSTNWSTGVVPTACSNVTIPSGGTQPVISGIDARCDNLTIDIGATLDVTSSNTTNTLRIYGNLINNGTINHTATAAPMFLEGVNKVLGGTGTYTAVTTAFAGFDLGFTDGKASYTLTSNWTLKWWAQSVGADGGAVSLGSNTLHVRDFRLSTGGNLFFQNTGNLEIEENAFTFTETGGSKFNVNTGTTCFCSGDIETAISQTVPARTFYHLKVRSNNGVAASTVDVVTCQNLTTVNPGVAGGSVNLLNTGTRTINGNVTIGAGNTFSVGATNSKVLDVKGNWTNNGTFIASSGGIFVDVNLIGSVAQTIGGTSATTFYNLTINNSAAAGTGVTQNTAVTVSNVFTLTAGEFKLNSLTAIVTNAATTAITRTGGFVISETNAATNNSILQWNIGATTGAHVFPFGTAARDYIPVTFDNKGNTSGNVSISTRPTATNTNEPKTTGVTKMTGSGDSASSAVDRWWEITAVTNPILGTGADVTFSYLGTENATTTLPLENRGVQHWTGTGWNDGKGGAEGTVTTSANAGVTGGVVGTVAVTSLTQFSPFIVVRGATPLPISLLKFTARPVKDIVKLDWSTATETNNDYFTIERSQNTKDWEEVGRVKGAGNSSEEHNYASSDEKPYKGVSYYRLKQNDYDGKYDYSKAVAVEFSDKPVRLYVYPNPARTTLNVYSDGSSENLHITICDVSGKIVKQYFPLTHNSSIQPFNIVAIDISNLANGMYFITSTTNEEISRVKFVKE